MDRLRGGVNPPPGSVSSYEAKEGATRRHSSWQCMDEPDQG